jgi:energy-coupling factor transporter ATP-binding protein EcfA2
MKIRSIRIQNLRSIKDETIEFDDYTCLVGPNGSGKSNVLCALNILFREVDNAATDMASLTIEDFHAKDVSEPIEITVTFIDLNDEAQEDFKEYYRHDRLVIMAKAIYDEGTKTAEVKQYGQRLGLPAFKEFFKMLGDGVSATELKAKYAELKEVFKDLPAATTKQAMTDALRAYESARPEQCELIPSEDQFYGVSKGADRLNKYLQWVYVPAVKDPTQEQAEAKNTALGKLLARTVRSKVNFQDSVRGLLEETRSRYEALLTENQPALDGISATLGKRLSEWAHPDATLRLAWQQDPNSSVRVAEPFAKIIAGESNFEGDLVRFGHGFQRSYLLALLQELAGADDATAPCLVLGIEEPELYQHPPQARHLASTLLKLAAGNAQVMLTTHSPYFVSGERFESVRMVRRNSTTKRTRIRRSKLTDVAAKYATATGARLIKPIGTIAKIHQALQPGLNEMFFTQRLILVEGLEDLAYLMSWLSLSDRMEEFRRLGGHIVPVHGKSELLRPLIIAQGLEIPVYVLFDADGDKIEKEDRKKDHERDNLSLLKLLGGDETQVFPSSIYHGANWTMFPTDFGAIVDAEIVAALGEVGFNKIKNESLMAFENEKGLGKNFMQIGVKLAKTFEAGCKPSSLEDLCGRLLSF